MQAPFMFLWHHLIIFIHFHFVAKVQMQSPLNYNQKILKNTFYGTWIDIRHCVLSTCPLVKSDRKHLTLWFIGNTDISRSLGTAPPPRRCLTVSLRRPIASVASCPGETRQGFGSRCVLDRLSVNKAEDGERYAVSMATGSKLKSIGRLSERASLSRATITPAVWSIKGHYRTVCVTFAGSAGSYGNFGLCRSFTERC